MKNFSFLQRMFLLLFVGISMFAVQSCNEEIDKPDIENNDSENKEPLTLFKQWYLTDFSSSSSLDWQNDEVVSWGENMKFSTNALYWNSRLGGENTTYKLSKQEAGGTSSIGASFSAVNTNNTDDQRIITVKNMTEKYLLLYDSQEELYRAFVSATFAKFSNNGDNGGSGDNDDEEEGDDEEDEEEEGEWRDCYACNGTGTCYTCDGDGKGALIYGTDEYRDCKTCDGSGVCPTCDGSGKYWRKK